MREFFFPKSVAVVGASPNPQSVGGQILLQLSNFGGEVYPVNPKYDRAEVGGREVRFYARVSQLPKTPDLLVVAIPAHAVLEVIEEAGRLGVKAAIVVSGGFAEVGRDDLERRLAEVARRHGVRILGPNCIGVYNAYNGLDTMFLPRSKLARPPPGPLALLSQSGAVMTAALDWAAGVGIGVGIAVNFGNRLDVTEWEILQYLAGLGEVRAFAMYLEGFRRREDAVGFLKAVRTLGKPVVVYKAGRGVDSGRAVLSHTAAMAGSYEIYRGFFRQAGAVEAHDIVELFDVAKALATYSGRVRDVLVISPSGGLAVQIVDALNEVGLRVPELPREAQEELRRRLPPVSTVWNPIDLTGSGEDSHFAVALEVGLRYVDAAVVAAFIHPPAISERVVDYILPAFEKWKKPIVAVSLGFSPQVKAVERRLGERLVVVDTPRRAARVLLAISLYGSKVYNGGGDGGDQHHGG